MEAARPDPEQLRPPEVLLGYATYLCGRLALKGRRRASNAVGSVGLRLSSYAVLACLAEFGPSCQRELAGRLGLDPSDVVATVDDLEALGHVVRIRCTEDRRRHDVTITNTGTQTRLIAADALDHAQDGFLGGLNARERRQFVSLLRRALESQTDSPPSGTPRECLSPTKTSSVREYHRARTS